jgi:hypothetical protein
MRMTGHHHQAQTDMRMQSLLRSGFGIEIATNIILPWLVYILAQPTMGRIHALMASAVPPIAWTVIQLVKNRRVDALSMWVVAGIGLSLLAFLGGGSFRVLELREHLVTGVMGLVFVGSVAIRRPLAGVLLHSMVKRQPQAQEPKFLSLLNDPTRLTRMTLLIGGLMLAQTAVAIGLVFALPAREFLIVSPVASYMLLGLLVAGVFLYTRHRERKASAVIGHEQSNQSSQ